MDTNRMRQVLINILMRGNALKDTRYYAGTRDERQDYMSEVHYPLTDQKFLKKTDTRILWCPNTMRKHQTKRRSKHEPKRIHSAVPRDARPAG